MLDVVRQYQPRIAEICRRHRVSRLELFGSAATPDHFDPQTSDIDLLYEFAGGYAPDLADRYFGLAEDLEQLFHHPVDLISLKHAQDPRFLNQVNPQRIPLYAA